jgi:hypothetical protein
VNALPHYEALAREAMKVGWPLRFKTDLTTHDRAFLEKRDPSLPFAWVLAEAATYMAAFTPGPNGDTCATERFLRAVESLREPARYYFWSGTELREVSSVSALCTLLDEAEQADRRRRHRAYEEENHPSE